MRSTTGDGPIEVCVIGAGAAGLWAAAVAGERGCPAVILEKTPRTGTKILASGGTHCNLTTTLEPDAALRLFGRAGSRFLRSSMRALPPRAVRSRFHDLGVPTVESPLEKVFPASGRATDVRDALERWAIAARARIQRNAHVVDVTRDGEHWLVRLESGDALRCVRLLVCPGGRSYPRTGTTGEGYGWLARLGVRIVPPVPALVPLRSRAAWVRELTGVSLPEVEARLVDPTGTVRGRRRRPVLFTHHGVSGPGAMDLSEIVSRDLEGRAENDVADIPSATGNAERHRLLLDLAPDRDLETVRRDLLQFVTEHGRSRVGQWLVPLAPRRVREEILHQAGVDPSLLAAQLPRPVRHRIVELVKGFPVPIDGVLGWDSAEVTAGGVSLEDVDPRTMRVRPAENLWAFGEILDLTGPIGGLNFQAAFATAEVAARDVASRAPV